MTSAESSCIPGEVQILREECGDARAGEGDDGLRWGGGENAELLAHVDEGGGGARRAATLLDVSEGAVGGGGAMGSVSGVLSAAGRACHLSAGRAPRVVYDCLCIIPLAPEVVEARVGPPPRSTLFPYTTLFR